MYKKVPNTSQNDSPNVLEPRAKQFEPLKNHKTVQKSTKKLKILKSTQKKIYILKKYQKVQKCTKKCQNDLPKWPRKCLGV